MKLFWVIIGKPSDNCYCSLFSLQFSSSLSLLSLLLPLQNASLLSENSSNHPLYCDMIPCLLELNFVFFLLVCAFLLSYYTFQFFTPSKRSQN